MNVTTDAPTRRWARVVSVALAGTGAGLLAYAVVAALRFELVLAALGLTAGAGLVALLVISPGSLSVVSDEDD
jgi:hypothetical protein